MESSGALIQSYKSSGTTEQANAIINISGGATAKSDIGILYTDAEASYSSKFVQINIAGDNTVVEGRIINQNSSIETTLKVSDGATWTSAGNSDMDYLTLDNANLDYTLTSLADHITVGEINTTGSNTMHVTLSNDTLEEINSNPLPYVIDLTKIIEAGLGVTDDIEYILADYNREGSTWEINKIAEGVYEISNINIIPEPAAAAGLLGALALVFVARRRK